MSTQSQNSQAATEHSATSPDSQRPPSSEGTAQEANVPEPNTPPKDGTENTPSDEERRKESSKLSQQALGAQKEAQELKQAADGAADPDERQRLMEEYIHKNIEAESFGKTAKYLQSGAFQGMAVGTGMGSVPGLTLGTLTGTLVGGTITLITGGLGGAIGAATGALHGPFWDMSKLAGKGIRGITGDLPGWKATDEQKAALEKMVGQVNEQEVPSKEDLSNMAGWDSQKTKDGDTKTWMEQGASYMPSMSSTNSEGDDKGAK